MPATDYEDYEAGAPVGTVGKVHFVAWHFWGRREGRIFNLGAKIQGRCVAVKQRLPSLSTVWSSSVLTIAKFPKYA